MAATWLLIRCGMVLAAVTRPVGKIPEFKFCAARVETVEPVTRVAAE